MGDKFMKSTSNLAVAIAAGLFMTAASMSASAADLGGNCCADLEERVAELEATTVRKGNRKVSLSLSGHVNRAVMIWSNDDGLGAANSDQSDIYSVGNAASQSRFRMKGSANIGGGWSAGFLLEYWVGDTQSNEVTQDDSSARDKASPKAFHDVLFIKNKQIGTFYMGHSSDSTDGIAEIDLSGTKVVGKFSDNLWNAGFAAGASTWGNYADHIDGFTGIDAVIRYDTPTFAGFTASGTYGLDDAYSVALRYANEFGGVLRVAAGIGYMNRSDESVNLNNDQGELTQLSGSLAVMHVPTGLNVAFSTGQAESSDTGNAAADAGKDKYWHVKAGIKQKWTSLGATALYGEYASYDMDNVNNGGGGNGVEATMWGLGVVQKIDAAAMEVYIAYRNYETDNLVANTASASEAEYSSAMVGARIKF